MFHPKRSGVEELMRLRRGYPLIKEILNVHAGKGLGSI
jgi:hypothetical protein